jgi:hypothetical protein
MLFHIEALERAKGINTTAQYMSVDSDWERVDGAFVVGWIRCAAVWSVRIDS